MGDRTFGIDPERIARIADEIADVHRLGVEVAVVLGGGNIIRGVTAAASGIDRGRGPHGNARDRHQRPRDAGRAREAVGHTRLISAIEMRQISEPFIRRRALRHLEKGRVVLFVGGTGNPYFTTDSAARANEIRRRSCSRPRRSRVYTDEARSQRAAPAFPTYRQALEENLG